MTRTRECTPERGAIVPSRRLVPVVAGLLAIAVAGVAPPAFGQVYVEDSEGTDLFLLAGPQYPSTFNLSANSQDKSVRGRAVLTRSGSPLFHAFELRARGPDGLGTVFTGGGISGGTSGAYLLGRQNLFVPQAGRRPRWTDRLTDWAFLRVGYTVDRFDLFSAEAPVGTQITSTTFRGLAVTGNYTLLVGGAHLVSVTTGFERRSNAAQLKEVKVQDTRTYENGDETRTVTRERTVREGAYDAFDAFPLRIAWTLKPDEDPAAALRRKWAPSIYYGRMRRGGQRPATLGVAAFLTQARDKSPGRGSRATIGGAFVEARDVFDVAETGKSLQHRVSGGIFVNVPLFTQR